jgi:hypothetical protein
VSKSIGTPYPLNQSPLYKLLTKKKLAQLLHITTSTLERLAKSEGLYRFWNEPKKNAGFRHIEAPFENLKSVQSHIAKYLRRIEPPDFLMAPVLGRSYVHNAAVHVGQRCFRLLDIEDFFPNCTDKKVFWFFHKVMLCSKDVAAILTKLTTRQGHLPQGSPTSPFLAFFAYRDMWYEISDVVRAGGYTLSIYADDITISGETIYERDIWAVKQLLHKHGHRYCADKERKLIGKPADVTGVIISEDRLLLPNRQHKKISILNKEYNPKSSGKTAETIARRLRGRHAQAKQILDHKLPT